MWMVGISQMADPQTHSKIHQLVLSETQGLFKGEMDSDARLRSIFKNLRRTGDNTYGLRLSTLGHKVMSKVFTCWEFEHIRLYNNKTLIDLDSAMTWPYYIGRDRVAFYNELDAAMFKLAGGELSSITDVI